MVVVLSSFALLAITILGSGITASGLRRRWPTTTTDPWRASSVSVTPFEARTARGEQKNSTATPHPNRQSTKPLDSPGLKQVPEQATVPSRLSTRKTEGVPASHSPATPTQRQAGVRNWRRFEWHEPLIDERASTTTTPTGLRNVSSSFLTTGEPRQNQMKTTASCTNAIVIVSCALGGLLAVGVVVVLVCVWMTRFRKRTDLVDPSPSLHLHTIETEFPSHGYASQQSTVPYAPLDKPPASTSTAG
ncbi:hypothetical protein NP493_987g00063 [Ridgeia piscesae]|uniref:Uncharacterized protein n=1 Tax=Ridgeia piscesae TaxID=27915 RepID=A0AAD9KJ45_RIDPI|nr:hypothetical protein NP493_987g00063 [Ridgeia piscesae]